MWQTFKSNGGLYSKSENRHPHVVIDANLITRQNPASSAPATGDTAAILADAGGAEPMPLFTMPP